MAAMTQAEAKKRFLRTCRDVLRSGKKVYVKDKRGARYLTLTRSLRNIDSPVVDASAQFVKDNFGRASSLVKDGVCFRLSLRGTSEYIYARRHTSYSDPIDDIIAQWRQRVADAALAGENQRFEERIRRITDCNDRNAQDLAELTKDLRKWAHGIARMAIGHRPFKEGLLSQMHSSDLDEDEHVSDRLL